MKNDMRALTIALCLWAPAAWAKGFKATTGSEVTFNAKITGSSFVARTEAVSGTVDYDEAAGLVKTATLVVKADSFRTGMDTRDEHTRDRYLEAARFPEVKFELKDAKVSSRPGSEATVTGTMTIKGVKKSVQVKLAIAGAASAPLVTATFPLNVTEFGIPQPKFAVVKMDPVIQVTAKIVFKPAG
jgi:polyisoprenoid-binding protein YceI